MHDYTVALPSLLLIFLQLKKKITLKSIEKELLQNFEN